MRKTGWRLPVTGGSARQSPGFLDLPSPYRGDPAFQATGVDWVAALQQLRTGGFQTFLRTIFIFDLTNTGGINYHKHLIFYTSYSVIKTN